MDGDDRSQLLPECDLMSVYVCNSAYPFLRIFFLRRTSRHPRSEPGGPPCVGRVGEADAQAAGGPASGGSLSALTDRRRGGSSP